MRPISLSIVLLSLVVPVVFALIGIATLADYSETFDEFSVRDRGEAYFYGYSRDGIDAILNLTDINKNHPPLFSTFATAFKHYFHDQAGIFESGLLAYHASALLMTVLSIFFVFWFSHYLWGVAPAFLSSVLFALLPRLIGHSQNNLKDPPTMLFFLVACFLFYIAVSKQKRIYYLAAGMAAGLTYCVRVHALMLLPLVGAWYLFSNHSPLSRKLDFRKFLNFSLGMLISVVTAFATILVVWPYYRIEPFSRFQETFHIFAQHPWNWFVRYMGEFYLSYDLPWHYPFVLFGITTPLLILIPFLGSLIAAAWMWVRDSKERSPLVFLSLWFFTPPLIHVLTGTAMYDGIRHWLLVLPALAMLASYGICKAWSYLEPQQLGRGLLAIVVALGIIQLGYTNFRLHPYQVVYFNSLTGGLKGAADKFDLDNWGHSFRETGEWMNSSIPSTPARIRVYAPLGFHLLNLDMDKFIFVDREEFPEYQVNLTKAHILSLDNHRNYLNPDLPTIFSVDIDGAKLIRVLRHDGNIETTDLGSLKPIAESRPANAKLGLQRSEFLDSDYRKLGRKNVVTNLAFQAPNKPTTLYYEGMIWVENADNYCISLQSDDGAVLYLNDDVIISKTCCTEESRTVPLSRGAYSLRVKYKNTKERGFLYASWSTNGCTNQVEIRASDLFH